MNLSPARELLLDPPVLGDPTSTLPLASRICRDGLGDDGRGGCMGDDSTDGLSVIVREGGGLGPGDVDSRYCSVNFLSWIRLPSSAKFPSISGISPLSLYSSIVCVFRPVRHQQ